MALSFSLLSSIPLSANAASKQVLNIQHWKTTQGIPVYFVRTPELPMVDLDVVFDAGSARDGEKFGIAQFTAGLIDEGAGDLSSDQIAEKFDNVGSIYSASVNQDLTSVGFRSLTAKDKLASTLDTFVTVLTDPKFPQDQFERLQKQTLTSLEQMRQSPAALAKEAFSAAIYGKQPYAHLIVGTPTTVSQFTPEDAKKFYQTYYVGKNARILMVGNLTLNAAKQTAERIAAALPTGETPTPLAVMKPGKSPVNKNIVFPSQQTTILMGQMGISPEDPDFFPLMVGNHILGGGGLVSRLFEEVREKRGLVYNVSSKFSPLAARGSFFIFLQTRKEEAANAIELTQRVLKTFVEKGPAQKELDASKKNIIGSFPLQVSSNSDIVDQLMLISLYNFPLDFLDKYRENVEKVTRAQVRAAFQKHVQPSDISVITVGE